MTIKPFEPKVEEDLNRPYNVTLTEGQISTILYVLEGYINPSDDYGYDPEFRQDIDSIFGVLEGAVDSYYDEQKQIAQALYDSQQKQPIPEWDDTVEDAQENNVAYSSLNENTEYGKDVRTADDVAKCVTDSDGDYAKCVDQLVDSMNPTFHMDQAFAKLEEEL